MLPKIQRETLLSRTLVCLVMGRRTRLEEWELGFSQIRESPESQYREFGDLSQVGKTSAISRRDSDMLTFIFNNKSL